MATTVLHMTRKRTGERKKGNNNPPETTKVPVPTPLPVPSKISTGKIPDVYVTAVLQYYTLHKNGIHQLYLMIFSFVLCVFSVWVGNGDGMGMFWQWVGGSCGDRGGSGVCRTT